MSARNKIPSKRTSLRYNFNVQGTITQILGNLRRMRTITHTIGTRTFFRPSVQLEKKRPGNEARTALDFVQHSATCVRKIVMTSQFYSNSVRHAARAPITKAQQLDYQCSILAKILTRASFQGSKHAM